MAQKNLDANITLKAKIDKSASELQNWLEDIGNQVNKYSEMAQQFLMESAEVYKDYETNMLAVRGIFSKDLGPTELEQTMESLDEYASQWAASTIFHTDDVAQAIANAARAGWSFEEIILGIPSAMHVAQAGGMDLSQAVKYLTTILKTTGSEFDEAERIMDEWTMAANSSNTTIEEMGQAFSGLGAAAKFGDSTQELFTMLAVLANNGVQASQAGTQLRGVMMRLIAPTTKAEAAMSLLGAEAEELEEVLADENVTKAAKKLQGLGFSAYDAEGNLLPMIEIFRNLETAMVDLDEQSRNEILAAIFPTRTIAAAQAFMAAISNGEMDTMFTDIGNSAGYAGQLADTMMSGLMGAIETLSSKWEEFQRQVGEQLAPKIEEVAGWLGSITDAINNMDDEKMSAIVGGIEGIAAVGPMMLLLSAGLKIFTTPGAWQVLAVLAVAAGVGALVGYLDELANKNFEAQFGTVQLNLEELGGYVDSLNTKFDEQKTKIAEWEKALDEAEKKYASTGTSLSEKLLTFTLTKKSLTADEIKSIEDYADELYYQVIQAVNNARASDMTLLAAIFGDTTSVEDQEGIHAATQLVMSGYDSLFEEANEIGLELRHQLVDALTDNVLDETERQAIEATIDRYNQIMAEISSYRDTEAYYTQLSKAQRVSWDTIDAFLEGNAAKYAEGKESVNEQYDVLEGRSYAAMKQLADNGGGMFTDLQGKEHYVTADNIDWMYETLIKPAIEHAREAALKSEAEKYGSTSFAAFDTLMNDSDFADVWGVIKSMSAMGEDQDLYSAFLAAGVTPENYEEWQERFRLLGGWKNSREMRKTLEPFKDTSPEMEFVYGAFGAMDTWVDALEEFATYAREYENSLGTGGIYDPWNVFTTPEYREGYAAYTADNEVYNAKAGDLQLQIEDLEGQNARLLQERADYIAAQDTELVKLQGEYEAAQAEVDRLYGDRTAKMAERDLTAETLARVDGNWWDEITGGNNRRRRELDTEYPEWFAQNEAETAAAEAVLAEARAAYEAAVAAREAGEVIVEPPDMAVEGYSAGTGFLEWSDEQMAANSAQIEALQAELDALTPPDLTMYVEADEDALTAAQERLDSLKAPDVTVVTGLDTSAYDRWTPKDKHFTAYVTVAGMPANYYLMDTFAEGGRADEPSIFGEAGAEWAIPEAHTERTASLLNQAREASGFTWDDLIARYGGLNAGNGAGVTVNYAPVVNAADATGVERVLKDDKKRMMKVIRDALDEMRFAESVAAFG